MCSVGASDTATHYEGACKTQTRILVEVVDNDTVGQCFVLCLPYAPDATAAARRQEEWKPNGIKGEA